MSLEPRHACGLDPRPRPAGKAFLRRAIAGSTAALACAALLSGAFISPAVAAPSAGPLAGVVPASPSLPSDDEIAQAKASESATSAEAAKMEALLDDATRTLQGSVSESMRANDNYSNAILTAESRKLAAAAATAKADAAAKGYEKAKSQVGQLAGNLYKTGGMNPSVQTMVGGSGSTDMLYQASTLAALTENRTRTYASAESAAATSTALRDAATAAQKAADDAAKAAEDAKAKAQSASDAQNAVVAQNASQRAAVVAKLATLHNTTTELEDARVTALEAQKAAAALAAQIAASANAPTPAAPAQGGSAGGNTGSNNAGSGSNAGGNAGGGNTGGGSNTVPPPVTQPEVPVTPPAPPPVVVPPVTPPDPPVTTPPPASGVNVQVMVSFAMSKVGGQYVWGGTGPGYDCSGLVYKAFAAAGVNVARTGTAQFYGAPTRVPLSQLQYGDLMVWGDPGNFYHIAIYIGNNQVVQALNPQDGITVTPLSWMSPAYGYAARY